MKKAKPAGVTISFTTEELAELAAVMNNLVVDWHKEHAGALDQARFKILNNIQGRVMNEDATKLPGDLDIAGLKLVCTCPACPEQYDVFDGDMQIGYLRLRHGYFRADYPDHRGETVYESNPKGDGIFDDDERLPELTAAVEALVARHKKGSM